jgi:hypothetical protein
MPRLYMDEQFPKVVSGLLRSMGHDVLTVQEAGNGNLGIPDEEVLSFTIGDKGYIPSDGAYVMFEKYAALAQKNT